MNLKRCNNGHYYDADVYSSCPHCDPTISASDVTVPMTAPQDQDDVHTMPLPDAIDAAVNSQMENNLDDAKTVSYYSSSLGAEPVVGWLACIEGDHYGESFSLKSGRNFIGRSDSQDVALSGDMSVSREKHAIIIYEPKGKTFIAQAGDSRELFYLNDKVVLSNEILKNYDVLTIGDEKLIFMALCGPEFCWEDTRKDEENEEK